MRHPAPSRAAASGGAIYAHDETFAVADNPLTMSEKALRTKIRRLERRAARIRRRLANLEKWNERGHDPVRRVLVVLLKEDPEATDDELVDALVDKVDDLMRFKGAVAEVISDVGIHVFARVAVWVVRNRKEIMTRRVAWIEQQIEALKAQLKDLGPKGATRDDELADIFLDLGIDLDE